MADVTISEKALFILRKGFEIAGLDPAEHGVRVRIAGGMPRTSFADAPEAGDQVIEAGDLRVFIDAQLAAREFVRIDVTSEHETLTVT